MLAFESYKGIIGNSNAGDVSKTLTDINPLNYSENQKPKAQRMTKEMALKFLGQQK